MDRENLRLASELTFKFQSSPLHLFLVINSFCLLLSISITRLIAFFDEGTEFGNLMDLIHFAAQTIELLDSWLSPYKRQICAQTSDK